MLGIRGSIEVTPKVESEVADVVNLENADLSFLTKTISMTLGLGKQTAEGFERKATRRALIHLTDSQMAVILEKIETSLLKEIAKELGVDVDALSMR